MPLLKILPDPYLGDAIWKWEAIEKFIMLHSVGNQ